MKLSIKGKVASVALSFALAAAMLPACAFADSTQIVTLGADLTDDQKATVLEFFGLDESNMDGVETITVTNADEHKYCDSSIPTSVTGTRTLSCSYIQPTTSGGINVKTANLTYVTSSALYNALQTAGVQNCNLVVTAPFEVSGTGALTGVFMAYADNGQALDSSKSDLAVEEMYETSALQETYGDDIASVIGQVKDEVVSAASDMTQDQIVQLIKDKAAEYNITLSDEDIQNLAALVMKMQDMGYDASAFATTLDDVKSALGDMGQDAGGAVSALGNFFQGIVDFFTGLFGGSSSDSGSSGSSSSADSIIDHLNTQVFKLDQ